MAALEHKYNMIENGGETALAKTKKESFIAMVIRKIKELFGKKETIEE